MPQIKKPPIFTENIELLSFLRIYAILERNILNKKRKNYLTYTSSEAIKYRIDEP